MLKELLTGALLDPNSGRAQVEEEPAGGVEQARRRDLTITVTFDNNPYADGCQTGWGFSCLVRGIEKTILFDTGADGRVLMANLRALQLDPEQVEMLVLSHAHGDHVDGLTEFLKANVDVSVYLLRSFPESFKAQIRRVGAEVIEVHEAAEICDNVYTTGEMGRGIIEQALVIETQQGLVVITGCAHPGIANIAREAKQMRERPLYLVMGGFHLSGQSAARIQELIRDLQGLGVERAAPCHCSGDLARELFEERFGVDYISLGVGKTLVIEGAFAQAQ